MITSTQTQTSVLEDTREKTRYAPRWHVLGLDDDVTTMDYVMILLMEVFHKGPEEAFQLMMEVHETGSASWYVGTFEACELKVEQVQTMNESYDQNLKVSIEALED
jgi:ATP-dependent Clp protease adaptor protein ClpS